MKMIEINAEDKGVQEALGRVIARTENPKGILEAIGDMMILTTKHRFGSSVGPDGQRWAPNSEVTILQYLAGRSGTFEYRQGRPSKVGPTRQKDHLTAKGMNLVVSKKPLWGRGGPAGLHAQIISQIQGTDTLLVGSPLKYASTQQFGAERHQFKDKAPWGDIPARPFLGISTEDRGNILSILSEQLLPPR